MAGIDRHTVVLGGGLVATAVLAFAGGLAVAVWLGLASDASPPSPPAVSEAEDPTTMPAAPAMAAPQAGAPVAAGPETGSASPTTDSAHAEAGFLVQVGAFLDRQAADAVASQLAWRGFHASIATRTDRTGAVWYTPVVGAYDRRAVAMEAAREVARRAGLDARVVGPMAGGAS